MCIYLMGLPANAQRYVEVSAVIESVHYDSDHTNDPIQDEPVHFICTLGTNEWRIDNDFVVNGRQTWHFDGTNVYDSIQITNAMPREMTDRVTQKWHMTPLPFDQAKSNVQINVATTTGGHPFGNEGVNLPWLAYCSGTYLKREGRIIPPPMTDLPGAVDAYAYSDQTETFEDDFGLPRKLNLLTSDSLHEASVNQFFYRIRREKPKPRKGFGNGILKFHYEVLESTNFLGWNFPVQFVFFQNDWRNGNWYLRFRGTGRLSSIRAAERPQGLFVPGKQETIVDYRFADNVKPVEGLSYVTTNGFLAPTNDPDLLGKFTKRVEKVQIPQRISSQAARWVLVGLFLLTTAPLLVIFLRRKTPNKNTNKP